MFNIRPNLGSAVLGAALTLASCVTSSPSNPNDGTCTDPKLAIMSHDVATSINMVLMDMKMITFSPITKINRENFIAAENDPPLHFIKRSMLINGNSATMCDAKDDGAINCYLANTGNLSEKPIRLHNLRAVSLGHNTVSLNQPVDPQHPLKLEWISIDEKNKACSTQNRYGISKQWCYDPITGEQPKGDLDRESACTQDFYVSQDGIKKQLDAYLMRLSQ